MSGSRLGLILSIVYICYVVLVTVQILLKKRQSQIIISWLLTIYFLPYAGILLYLLFGLDRNGTKIVKTLPEDLILQHFSEIHRAQSSFIAEGALETDGNVRRNLLLLLNGGHSIITMGNEVVFHYSGADHFESLLNDIEAARHSIRMEYFIWRSDNLGRRLLDLLEAKVREGVEVQLLFDGVGCFFTLSRAYRKALKASNIEHRYFLDPRSVVRRRFVNYRNHRKIVVIDGRIGYTGGMNVGDEYITGGRRFTTWRDTHMRMTGHCVSVMEAVFFADWSNSGGAVTETLEVPEVLHVEPGVPVQIVCSGPDSRWDILRKLYITLLTGARRRVFIQSPYFVPDESVLSAMETAALGGVDVRLMIAGVPDKRVPFWVAENYFPSLLEAGVRIFRYTAGFLHAKTISADGEIAAVGSCNLDVRSLQIDYEMDAVLYDASLVSELDERFTFDCTSCTEITAEFFRGVSFPLRLRNALCKIIVPLL